MKESYHNFRTSDDIVMKFEPITKLVKRKKQRQKTLTKTLFWKIVTSVSFSLFMVRFMEPSQSRIRESVKLTLPSKVTFYLKKS